jgi:hypothetical protein
MTLPVSSPFAPMETLSVLEIRVATNGSTNRNGTSFLVWFSKDEVKNLSASGRFLLHPADRKKPPRVS